MTWYATLLALHVAILWAGAGVVDRWFGAARALFDITSSDDPAVMGMTIHFSSPLFHNGDTLLRIVGGYWLRTAFVDNSSLTEPYVNLWGCAVWWEPNPQSPTDPTSDDVGSALYGDALYTDMVRWRPSRWTDGTLHATEWYADSGPAFSAQGQRTILDQDTATLNMYVGPYESTGAGGTASLEPQVSGLVWVRYLVRIQG